MTHPLPVRRFGFAARIAAAAALRATPACRVRANGLAPARRSGFTLLELVVSMGIAMALASLAWPVFGAMANDTRTHMAASQVTTALQANILYAREYKQADANAAEPRVVGAAYAGTAVVFDQVTHKAWFCLNDQRAAPMAPNTNPYLEIEPDPDYPAASGIRKKAYVRIRGETIEHLDLPESQVLYGVSATFKADGSFDTFALVGGRRAASDAPAPFAVCALPNGEGLPQRRHLYTDLLDGDGYQTIATALPWVVVVPAHGNAPFDPSCLDAVPGATDLDKLNALINHAGGRMVEIAVGGAGKL